MILGDQNYDQGLLQAKITTTDLHCIRSGCHGRNANDLNVTESSVWGSIFCIGVLGVGILTLAS